MRASSMVSENTRSNIPFLAYIRDVIVDSVSHAWFHIIRQARIENVGTFQSCMASTCCAERCPYMRAQSHKYALLPDLMPVAHIALGPTEGGFKVWLWSRPGDTIRAKLPWVTNGTWFKTTSMWGRFSPSSSTSSSFFSFSFFFFFLSLYLSIYLSLSLSFSLSIYLSIYLSILSVVHGVFFVFLCCSIRLPIAGFGTFFQGTPA